VHHHHECVRLPRDSAPGWIERQPVPCVPSRVAVGSSASSDRGARVQRRRASATRCCSRRRVGAVCGMVEASDEGRRERAVARARARPPPSRTAQNSWEQHVLFGGRVGPEGGGMKKRSHLAADRPSRPVVFAQVSDVLASRMTDAAWSALSVGEGTKRRAFSAAAPPPPPPEGPIMAGTAREECADRDI